MLLPLQVIVLIKRIVFVKIVKFPCGQNGLGVGLAIWRVSVRSSRDLFFICFFLFYHRHYCYISF